jgi:hypothetical protein
MAASASTAHAVMAAMPAPASNLDYVAFAADGRRQAAADWHSHGWSHQAESKQSCGRGRDDHSLHGNPLHAHQGARYKPRRERSFHGFGKMIYECRRWRDIFLD